MRDYYKILGVKETASEEEIRERWIKLMRRLHPDHAGEKGSDDQRIREINEAYEVLKYSSSRVKHDLQRAYDRRRKRASFRRAVFRKSYLLFFPILIGLIYFSIQKPPPLFFSEAGGKAWNRFDQEIRFDFSRRKKCAPPRQEVFTGPIRRNRCGKLTRDR